MRRFAIPAIASICGAALLALLIYGVSHQAASRTLDEAVALRHWPAAPEPRHVLPALNGSGTADLASYAGKVVVLNFWASWCVPCEQEAPMLERTQRVLERHDATVLGVTFKDITSDSEGFVRRFHLTYPTLRDSTGSFAQSYGTDQLPESFVIDRSGKVVAISRGEVDQQFLAQAIRVAENQA